MKRFLLTVLPALAIVWSLVVGTGCANIIPPSGGPRDTLPPVLVSANPPDSATNFRGNRIVLTFNEYVNLQDVSQNLLFTPTFETNPMIEARLRTLTLRLRDTLEPNTTYTFNFGNAIRDVNESNVLPNFTYTFSTGPVLDSLELRGNVVLAQSGKVDSTLIVILHASLDDSAVVNRRPRYVTKVDGAGNFRFTNLPANATFAIYALGDAGITRRYSNNAALFAFADSAVTVRPATAPITLYAYREAAASATNTTAPATASNDRRLRYSLNQTGNQQDLLKNLVLTFERPLRTFDSNGLKLSADSTFTPVRYTTTLDSTRQQVTVKTDWQPGIRYNLILEQDVAEDTLGRRLLKGDTLFFNTRARADYGAINIRLRGMDTTQKLVLQFVQNEAVVFSAPVNKEGRVTRALFLPGEYTLRILFDENGNGKWDPGRFFGIKKQPERVRPIDRTFTVKPAWDNELELQL